jgi:hypothetical protein
MNENVSELEEISVEDKERLLDPFNPDTNWDISLLEQEIFPESSSSDPSPTDNFVFAAVSEFDENGKPRVDPNFKKRELTRRDIHQIYLYYNSVKSKYNKLQGHPDFSTDECPSFEELLKRTGNLFIKADLKDLNHILLGLQEKFPSLKMNWQFGSLNVNGMTTKFTCKQIDKAHEVLRELGTSGKVDDIIIDLISSKLGEIFKA